MPPAVFRGLNRLRGQPLDDDRLHRLARTLGADVPFFLLDGPALGEGIGDRLTRDHAPGGLVCAGKSRFSGVHGLGLRQFAAAVCGPG